MQLYFGLMAGVFLAAAIWLSIRRSVVAARGVNTPGRVVGHEARQNDDAVYYLPVVVFSDRDGGEHRFTAVAGGSTPRPAVGAAVTVRYLPDRPDRAFVVSFLHMWAAPLAMLVLAAGALVAYWKA